MKQVFKTIVILITTALLLPSCSSDEEVAAIATNGTFILDGQTFKLLDKNPVKQTRVNNLSINGQFFDSSKLTIKGYNGNSVGIISFDLYYKDGLPVVGTYSIFDVDDDAYTFEEKLAQYQKICYGWTSFCKVTLGSSTTPYINLNNPVGTVQVTDIGNNLYTIKFNGKIKEYDDDLVHIGYVPISVDVTTKNLR